MPKAIVAYPEIELNLYKTISRESFNSTTPASARYRGKDPAIDLTPFLQLGSSVNVKKSLREPAGTFSITFADRPQMSLVTEDEGTMPDLAFETIYALIEPMDMIEIRMWGGIGPRPAELPVKMRGFVSNVGRQQTMGAEGTPVRNVTITGHDYGKIWQMYQILYLPAYVSGAPLLTNFEFSEMFGTGVDNTIPSSTFVSRIVSSVINPFIQKFIPEESPLPSEIGTSMITVPNGVINNAYQSETGNVYNLLKKFGDVGIWNELFTLDTNAGVECVYRVSPVLDLSAGADDFPLLQDGAVMPPVVTILDEHIENLSASRTDSNVANFYWVNNQRFDLINETYRKQMGITEDDGDVYLRDYKNSDPNLYGVRPLYGDTMQAGDDTTNLGSGLSPQEVDVVGNQFVDWIDIRRSALAAMNRDNAVFETGSIQIKGGPERPPEAGSDNVEAMKVGDYAKLTIGNIDSLAYITEMNDQFLPFTSYVTTLTYERGNNFATRGGLEGSVESPWLYEQATRVKRG